MSKSSVSRPRPSSPAKADLGLEPVAETSEALIESRIVNAKSFSA